MSPRVRSTARPGMSSQYKARSRGCQNGDSPSSQRLLSMEVHMPGIVHARTSPLQRENAGKKKPADAEALAG